MDPHKQFKTLFIAVFISVTAIACGLGNILPGEGNDSSGDGVIFFDDFSDSESGWERSYQGGIKNYFEGTYQIKVDSPNYISWSLASQAVGDSRISVELAFLGEADVAEMGIICRYVDSGNFYYFSIRSDGYYGLFKRQENNEFFLGMDGYQPSSVINQGITSNFVEAECAGDRLSLFVNGQHLISVNDASFHMGDVGLIVGAYDQPNVIVYFDNFKVVSP